MFCVERVDNRWTILGPCAEKPGAKTQLYTPPDFLHEAGKTCEALTQMADQLNTGCRYIDVVMDHEATYHRDQVGLTLDREMATA
jgi:hypothetical protein